MDDQLRIAALEYHRLPKPGKISVTPTKGLINQRDLALAYSPGVAAACEAIVADPAEARALTSRGNLIGHLGKIHPDLRQLVIDATAGGVDTDAIVCPASGTGNLLAGVTIPLEAHTSLGWPQVLAVPVADYPEYFTGGGTVSDRPWATMEFFFAAKTDATPDEIANACVYDFMNLGRKLELQAAMERNMADPLSQLFRARQDPLFKWRWGAEARLCMAPTSAPSDFSDLYTRLGGWFERPSTAPSSPDTQPRF